MSVLEKPKIYLDYETNMAHFFYLVGYSFGGEIEQIILTPELRSMAEEKALKLLDPVTATEFILEIALREKAVIVAYGRHEKRLFNEIHQNHDLSRFAEVPYIDLARAAWRWVGHYRAEEFEALGPYMPNLDLVLQAKIQTSLASRMRLTDFPPPPMYSPLHTTSRFNAVIQGLTVQNQNYAQLTSV